VADGGEPCPSACCWSSKGDAETEALGRSQGGFSTKVHLRPEGTGKLLTLLLTPGQRHEAVIFPRKSTEQRTGPFDRPSSRQRNKSERLINRYKQFRRMATRYGKRAANDQAMWLIATIILWLGFANTP
jgi:hypothetical protein